ncbi:hypothetical protein EJB05_17060, partial [Eragrostis curvula]
MGYGYVDPFLPPPQAVASVNVPQQAAASLYVAPQGDYGQPQAQPAPRPPGCPYSSSASAPPVSHHSLPPATSAPPVSSPPPASPPPEPLPPPPLPPSPPPPALSPPPPDAPPPSLPPSLPPSSPPSPPPVDVSAPPPPMATDQPRVQPRVYPSPPPPSLPSPPPPTVSPPAPAPSLTPSPSPAPAAPAPAPARTAVHPPPPPRIASPPPPRYHVKPHYVMPHSPGKSHNSSHAASNSGKNIEISREAATTIVALAGLAMLNGFYLRSPGYPFMRTSTGSHGFPYSPADSGIGYSRMLFTPENLAAITNDFADETLLGEGGFGCVYKGILPDGRPVAVKKLKIGNGQGEREFKAEVDTISRVHHRHLVSLVGYCISESQRMLVYDFVPNNTLYYHLHVGQTALDWRTRVKIAAGAARGIAYLHEDCHPRIIHRDIKSSNILLDNNFEAQVSDFGLARLAADSNTHVTTRVMGTFGSNKSRYMARPLLIRAMEHRDFGDLPDPRMDNKFDENEMFHMIGAAAACIRHSAAMRPRMGQVVRALDSLADSNLNNGLQPGRSEVFLEPQSEEIRLFQLREFGSRDCSDELSQASWRSRRDL